MLGIGRRKSHGQLARAELGEGLGHLRLAATHAAGGVGAAVGPRVDTARRSVAPTATRVRESAAGGWESTMTAVAPLAVAAADGARQAGSASRRGARSKQVTKAKKLAGKRAKAVSKRVGKRGRGSALTRRRWPALAGLLVAGAVAGAIGAASLRRRREAEWDSYDPAPMLETTPAEAVPVLARRAADPGHQPARVTATAMSLADARLSPAEAKPGVGVAPTRPAAQSQPLRRNER